MEPCHNESRISENESKVNKLDQVVFLGNGQPPLTVRVANCERTVSAIAWLCGVTCAAVVGQLVVIFFSHFR